MPRGGYREGAGGKPSWVHGRTKVIRVPEALAEQVLEIARTLDTGKSLVHVTESNNDPVTQSKVVDLSGIAIRAFRDGPGIYLADLMLAGYEIRPARLARSIETRARKSQQERVRSLKQEVDAAIKQLNLLED